MSTPSLDPARLERSYATKEQLLITLLLSGLGVSAFLALPALRHRLLSTSFLPHLYCYLGKPGLIWTHVTADALIGFAYLAISVTLAYVVFRAWKDLPFHWILLAFGLFIIACGGTHFMEVLTVWIRYTTFQRR